MNFGGQILVWVGERIVPEHLRPTACPDTDHLRHLRRADDVVARAGNNHDAGAVLRQVAHRIVAFRAAEVGDATKETLGVGRSLIF